MAGKLQVLSAAVPRPMAMLVDTLAARDGVNRSEWIRRALERAATERVSGTSNGKEARRDRSAR